MAENIKFKVDADTSKATKGADDLAKSFDNAGKEVKDTNKALKDGSQQGGRFGNVLKGIKFGAGFAAAKGLLDSVFAGLMQNEKVANLFNDAMNVITGTVNGIIKVWEPAFKFIGKAISKPKEAWDDVVSAFKTGATWIKENLIEGVLDIFTKNLNNISLGILTLRRNWNEWTGDAEEGAEVQETMNRLQNENTEITKRQEERVKNIKGAVGAYVDFVKKSLTTVGESIAQSVKGGMVLRDNANSYVILTAKINENIKALEEQQTQNEAIANDDRKSFAERKAAIGENIKLKKEQIAQEKELIQMQINTLALEIQTSGVSAQKSATIAALKIQMEGLDKTIKATERSTTDILKTIGEQEKNTGKAIGDATAQAAQAKAEAESQTEALEYKKLQNTLDTIAQQKAAYTKMYEERLADEIKGSAKYNEILAEKIAKDGEFVAQKIAGDFAYKQAVEANTKEQQALDAAVLDAKMGAISGALSGAKALFADNAEVQSAIAIGQSIMDTYAAANKALASAPPPYNFILMAGVIASGIANVMAIRQQAQELASEIGGSAPSGGVPQIGPSINIAKSNVDSNTQLGNAMNQSGKPPKAYVVSTEINTADSLDRKITQNATIG